ncbi:TonB-dependent receptor plug domain-containing protein [Lutibacter maritimus]|uniref:Iron complex outermembrane recepter protein n=1 Tax=Lutibacter maritimus TaxID=593133 RepID=A0A1I6SBW3_9FLAO|nr:TonB-dependent receptor [Lutibacter maritimus]SFS74417.1 iron complex outermembrane recepter protein [Lutibacter maritimus]
MKIKVIILFVFTITFLNAQNDTIKLKEVIVSANRISLPISEDSKTISFISNAMIKSSPATNLSDLLQSVAGIDIRRRGTDGMQSDLYIRGGNFDQTLVLIDGVKMDDAQTGHHTMNAILSLDNIESIEIIKGPAARVYGQNAFAGAINIVTKKINDDSLNFKLGYGSFENKKVSIGIQEKFTDDASILAHIERQESDGYRVNSDFKNTSAFIKSQLKNYTLISSFNDRKFGAENFYTSNPNFKEYEETQNSLVALSSSYFASDLLIKPRVYWRRNQDIFLLKRDEPSFYRNLHISNKIGFETNIVYNSKLGKTGFGIDLSKVYLSSNNLGDRNRVMFNSFLEQRFDNLEKFDVTLGIAISSFSDFKTQFLPGLDLGYDINDNFKIFGNIGYTYRVPTYTDLYYSDPGNEGNSQLQPESAISEEIGIKYFAESFNFTMSLFNRNSSNLIDWTRNNTTEKWKAQNFSAVETKGFETSVNYIFKLANFNQRLDVSYNFIDDKIKDQNVVFTRYSLNSLKHQFTTSLNTQFLKILNQTISYRYVERTKGNSYNLIDAKVKAEINKLVFSLNANNILNANYIEVGLVPMPKGNVMFGIAYKVY